MSASLFEDNQHMEMVHLVLKEMGCKPSVYQINGGGVVVSSEIEVGGGGMGTYDFNCVEVNHDELTYLFRTSLGKIDSKIFISLLTLSNIIHGTLFPPGTLYFSREEESGECYFLLSFTFLATGSVHEIYDHIEEYVHRVDEFFVQARWAVYEVATGGTIVDAINMLSIGETHANA
ncbi:MAG: hypothetical protein ACKKL4_01920 [Patescibacteria group bacterium]